MTGRWKLRWLSVLLVLLPASCLLATEAAPDLANVSWGEESVAPGVRLRQQQFDNLFGAAQFISVLEVQPDASKARVRFAAAQQFDAEYLTLPEIAEKAGAVAAINGGFFHDSPRFANSGILKIDGKVFPFLTEEPEDLRFVGSSAVGIDAREQWHFYIRSGETWPDDWKEVQHAIAGGHLLVLGGEIFPVVTREDYDPRRERPHAGRRNPRTAIGVTTNRVALLLTADGRHSGRAEGLTMKELAVLMRALGCENAINLDGGGSTTMWALGRGIVNHPCDNKKFDSEGARLIRSAVIVKLEEAATDKATNSPDE